MSGVVRAITPLEPDGDNGRANSIVSAWRPVETPPTFSPRSLVAPGTVFRYSEYSIFTSPRQVRSELARKHDQDAYPHQQRRE